ncbi:SoxR reducing system RseC family protein [Pseudoalteromonas denitrificans]|uniref:Positive regulator of sigma(E), RseC/MucC n=1 Tax=Pseudoalteromonas denitrificans DSM 6059 TaxID=1123010 RepID=A0A1I1HDG0_9GAMM|nr:SoxR reducing system RseC family protein [Pseudoalteromonas denitrificans]SFC21652.1 positive regulator of sigma(E), RseC/MucC [Pseudoalteromonas denitrificans DSM 6059]
MIEQTLTVTSVEGLRAFLKADEKPSCEGCSGQCGSKIFSKLFGDKSPELAFVFDEELKIGQKVKMALDDSHVLKSSLMIYLLPLISAMILAIFSSLLLSLSEGWQIIFALVGGVIGFLFAKKQLEKVNYDIKLIKIYPNSLPLTQIDGD